jgi:hypothetical protein
MRIRMGYAIQEFKETQKSNTGGSKKRGYFDRI